MPCAAARLRIRPVGDDPGGIRVEGGAAVLHRRPLPARDSSRRGLARRIADQQVGTAVDDAVDWRERLQAQLRDGSFHYVTVAQHFTPQVLRTLRYLNSTMKSARFSAVELVRFTGGEHAAFEARFVAGAEPRKGPTGSSKTALAGVDDFLAAITDDEYRHSLQDLLDVLVDLDGMTVFWGTTGCSLRVAVPHRIPLSIGWHFPPGPSRWMGLSDLTLGWYEDANGLVLSNAGRAALDAYLQTLTALTGSIKPRSAAIRGRTFPPAAVVENGSALAEAIRAAVVSLLDV
jgi:hypothetical protein